jgi:hypothetical protein
MKKSALAMMVAAVTGLSALAQNTTFLPGHLAVLRAGDGQMDLRLKQSPIFVDQFDASANNTSPSLSLRIPTNGPQAFFFNGHAATEGLLTRSPDHSMLAFAGYGGVTLLQSNGTPSQLGIRRGGCTIDASGTVHSFLLPDAPATGKMNPRGLATDGNNNFWASGNANGTLFYNPATAPDPVRFSALPNSRAVRIFNNTLFATINGADAKAADSQPGIYSLSGGPLPQEPDATATLAVPATRQYNKIADFAVSPDGTTAYTADILAGIQKYTKSGDSWKFVCNFEIPQNIPATLNNAAGCFGLAVDFTGRSPVVYATTTEGYGGSVNSNRVIRFVDNGAPAAVTTVAQATSTNVVFRGIDFTPEARPAAPSQAHN